MRMVSVLRCAVSAAALGGVAFFALQHFAPPAQGQDNFVNNGEVGFVVSLIEYGLSDDASETGACPRGMVLGGNRLREAIAAGQAQAPAPGTGEDIVLQMADVFAGLGQGQTQQRPQAQPSQGQAQPAQPRANPFARVLAIGNPCEHPERFQPDPNWRSVENNNVRVRGIDLDGQVSTANGRPAPGTCAHTDFRGFNGERGIDNQFFRAVGCSPSFQSGGSSLPWTLEMLTGAWGIVFRLRGVDDIRNDDEVIVDIAANADPIQLSPNREPLLHATYAMSQDPRFRASARGRIVNGVLTTEPVDVRFWKVTNAVWVERPLRDARLQATISPDGALDGYLAGYTPVDAMFDLQYAYRSGRTSPDGGPSPGRIITALGGNVTVGHTCNGAYYALLAAADGHPDPATGRCSSISTQYHVRAVPAFVVDAATQSANQGLEDERSQSN